MAADRLAGAPARSGPATRRGVAGEDIARFMAPFGPSQDTAAFAVSVGPDPLDLAPLDEAPLDTSGTPDSAPRPARHRLTAILVADNNRVAVIDDATVGVGDMLRDGSRVTSIQRDRVWLVDRTGQWRMLSLTPQGQ